MGVPKEPSLRCQLQEKLKPIDKLDKELTKQLAVCANNKSLYGNWRPYMTLLEYSCHGLLWLALCYIVLWFSQSESVQQVIVNLHTALILDIILVAVIKAAVRRGRPPYNTNDMYFTVSIDNYAFPSGHASRSVFLATIFYVKQIGGFFVSFLMSAWAIAVCFSRVAMGRHHVGDIIAGILLGLFEAGIILFMWFSSDTSQYILKMFTLFQTFSGADAGLDF